MRRSTRSEERNASGSPSARRATYCAVHGPMPGIRTSLATISAADAVRSSVPSAIDFASALIAATRDPVSPSPARSAAAISAALGNRRSSPAMGVTNRGLARSTMRRIKVIPAAKLTCWPTIARSAHSNGSHTPGIRRPGRRSTSGARIGSSSNARTIVAGSAARSNALRATADRCRSAEASARLTRNRSASSSPIGCTRTVAQPPPGVATVRA